MSIRPRILSAAVFLAASAAGLPSLPARAGDAPASCAGAEGPSGAGRGDGVAAPSAALRAMGKVPARLARTVRLAPLDVAALRREDDATRAALDGDWKRWNRVGVVRDVRPVTVPPSPARWGRAETLADGSRVFRTVVAAPGASGVRLRFRECAVPKGAEVTVHDADEPGESYGPLRVPSDAEGWLTPTVFGERVVLAVRIPAERLGERVRVTVDGVVHRYRPPEELEGAGPGPAKASDRAAGLGCMNNVACDASYASDVARAVARFEFTSGGNSFLCTGTLLNDLDAATDVPWLLTANHCVSTDKSARSMEVYWDYRASTCNGSPPALASVPRTLGATLAATSGDTDCTLVRLTGQIPPNRWYAGWTAVRPSLGDPVVGVHHPEGSHMRISYGAVEWSSAHFHDVVWNDGVTAQGSSGSAIFNAQKQVVGQLCCGGSFCNKPDAPDDYGRFDVSYADILEPFLGKTATSTGPDAWDPGDDVPATAPNLGAPGFQGVTHGPHTLVGADAADWFLAQLEQGVPYVAEASGAVAATVYADAAGTSVLVAESGGATGFSMVVVPQATGLHAIRVRRATPSNDASYTLSVERQDTTPPVAVSVLRATAKSGRVTVTWRDRARDEKGYRVEFLGGAGWVRVGELPANSRRFRHRPGPGHQIYRVGPYDAISTNWKEVAVFVRGRPGLDAWDPVDDTGAGATQVPRDASGLTDVHELDRNDVADWFRIDMVQGETWTFETESDGDTVGVLHADAGGLGPVAEGDDQEDLFGATSDYDFRFEFTAPATAPYWLQVRAYPTTPRATYRLRTTRR